jgi:hypothetical protein
MPHPLPACENGHVARRAHSPLQRATAALLAGLLTLAPALRASAAGAKTPVLEQARTLFGRAAELEKKGKHGQAADTLDEAIALLTSRPLALDEDGGQLLAAALVQLAVDCTLAGEDERSDIALAQLVRLSPDHVLSPSDYPPAFLLRLEGVRKRLLAPRGSLPLVSEAPAPSRRVAMPGAPVAEAPPSRALVIPREPTRDDADAPAAAAKPRPAPAPEKRIAALEPDAIKTVREPPAEKKNHALLWVLAGALLLGGLAAGGYYLYQSGQSPTSSTVTATWSH